MTKIKKMTVASIVLSIISWTAGLACLLMNLLGEWELWHAVGYFSYICVLLYDLLALINFQTCRNATDPAVKEYARKNNVLLILAIVLTFLEMFVFSVWFGL